jgi:hypothetical protein
MSALSELGRKPATVTAEEHFAPWFGTLAERLMNSCDLVIAGARYRFAELEMYYSGWGHSDLFAHRDPVQLEDARWYFHRTRGEYRGGSFKGLDLALGDGASYFGILIRTVIGHDGTVLDGPCVTVDHMLAKTKAASVATLDGLINARTLWDTTSPLHVVEAEKPRTAPVYQSSRVGLSLKKAKGKADAPKFVARPYRFLTEPQTISKGRPHLILALYRAGRTPKEINEITGVAVKTIDRYIADFALGLPVEDFEGYIGKDLGTSDLCKLLGTWHAKYGAPKDEKPAEKKEEKKTNKKADKK